MTSTILVRCSTNWAMKPRQVQVQFIPVLWSEWSNVYMIKIIWANERLENTVWGIDEKIISSYVCCKLPQLLQHWGVVDKWRIFCKPTTYLNKWGEESKAQFKRCAIVEWNLIVFKLDCRTTVDSVEFNLVVPDSTGWNVSRTRIKFDKSTGGNGVKCTYLIMLHWVWHKFSAKFRRGDRACRT